MDENQTLDYTTIQDAGTTLDTAQVLDPSQEIGTTHWYENPMLWVGMLAFFVVVAVVAIFVNKRDKVVRGR